MHFDVAITPWGFLTHEEVHPIIFEEIQPDNVIPMHFLLAGTGVFATIAEYFPNAIFIYNELDSWTMPEG